MSTLSVEDQAFAIMAPRKLHQMFKLPATDKHDVLKVTYAIAGPDIGEDVPTILFCGGMFGTRYMAMSYNIFAENQRVRMIFFDRPGLGSSTPVPIFLRQLVFLETVPALLQHLNIPHVHLASHSAGTTYALNLLWHRPDLLYPTDPTVHFFSPWVHQSISGVSFLSAAAMLPDSMLNHWDGVTSFIIQRAAPTFASSSGVLSSVTGLWKSEKKGGEKIEEERKCIETYGFGLDVKEALSKKVFKCVFAEDSMGANDEARMCLKSVEGCNWDACEDYEVLVAKLNEFWSKKVREGGKKLRVRIVFGEEDILIGAKGKKYWEDCWTQEKCGDGIEVVSKELKGGDHDSVIDATKGPIADMFAIVKQRSI